jgi:hypothetical protein
MALQHRERSSTSDVARQRSASRDLAAGVVVLIVSEMSLIVSDPDASAGPWHLAWALSPLVGIGLLVWAQVRILGRADELERADEMFAMATGFGVVIAALAAVGVLQAAEVGDARQQMQITTGLGITAWIVVALLRRRAR